VATGTGALFPNPTGGQYFYMTLANTSGTVEIVKVTARSTDVFTITRGQDNTSAVSWSSGDKVEQRVVAANFNNLGQLDSTNTWALAQTFTSGITGNVTGNVSGSSGSCTGNAANVTGTVAIANGGTNNGSLGVVAGGVYYGDGSKVVETAAGTSGQVLQSNGASAPTWATLSVSGTLLDIRYFTTVGTSTYTPTAGTSFVVVEVVGGGGGGTGLNSTTGTYGGGGGGYARKKILSAFSGVTITVGAAGTAGGTGIGGAGGTSSFGALVSATGGAGAIPTGGTGSSGDLNLTGSKGFFIGTSLSVGGNSPIYSTVSINQTATGVAGNGYGGGGTGSVRALSGVCTGEAGSQGLVIVYEYK
jgi:hypothetical protein